MGKTTLVETFSQAADEQQEPVRIGRGRCSERLAGTEAYLPILEALDSLQKHEQLGSVGRLIRAVAPSWYSRSCRVGTTSRLRRGWPRRPRSGSQERLKRELAALFEELGRLQPVVLCFDDMHWADSADHRPPGLSRAAHRHHAPADLATCRPSELAQARHPFLPVKARSDRARHVPRSQAGSLDLMSVREVHRDSSSRSTGFPRTSARLVHERAKATRCSCPTCCAISGGASRSASTTDDWVLTADLSAVERELPESIRSAVQRKVEALDDADRRCSGRPACRGRFRQRDSRRGAAVPEESRRSPSTGWSASMRSSGSSTSTKRAIAR
jgi:hypothetical protein